MHGALHEIYKVYKMTSPLYKIYKNLRAVDKIKFVDKTNGISCALQIKQMNLQFGEAISDKNSIWAIFGYSDRVGRLIQIGSKNF